MTDRELLDILYPIWISNKFVLTKKTMQRFKMEVMATISDLNLMKMKK